MNSWTIRLQAVLGPRLARAPTLVSLLASGLRHGGIFYLVVQSLAGQAAYCEVHSATFWELVA